MRRFVILGSIVLTALTLAVIVPGSGNERLSASDRAEAKALYETRCAACHHLYDPAKYAEDEWGLWMTRMSRKARLDPHRTKLLNLYLKSLRTEGFAGNPTPL